MPRYQSLVAGFAARRSPACAALLPAAERLRRRRRGSAAAAPSCRRRRPRRASTSRTSSSSSRRTAPSTISSRPFRAPTARPVGKTHDGGTLRLRKATSRARSRRTTAIAYWIRDYNHGQNERLRYRSDRQDSGNVRLSVRRSRARFGRIGSWPSTTCSRTTRFKPGQRKLHRASRPDPRRHRDRLRRRASSIFPTHAPWGCDAPAGTVTSLITADNQYLQSSRSASRA